MTDAMISHDATRSFAIPHDIAGFTRPRMVVPDTVDTRFLERRFHAPTNGGVDENGEDSDESEVNKPVSELAMHCPNQPARRSG